MHKVNPGEKIVEEQVYAYGITVCHPLVVRCCEIGLFWPVEVRANCLINEKIYIKFIKIC